MKTPLQLGFFIQPVHPPARAYADVLREDREAVAVADALGYREAFIGEHVADSAETITSSLMFIASLADRCPRIMFGTGVLPLPNYHPVMIAAQVAMVDHLVQGRLLLGIGPGVPGDAEALDAEGTDRRRQTAEALEQVLAIWAGEPPYRLAGEFYRTSTERTLKPEIGVGCVVKPLQRPHPPIVITCIRPEAEGPRVAALRGWTGISATYVGEHVVKAHIAAYGANTQVNPAGWRVARSVFVAEDEAVARDYVRRSTDFYFHVMRTKLGQGAPALMGEDDLVIAGTPGQVADRILAFRERVGPFGTLLYTGHDWLDAGLARRSMELMAHEVWPRVNAAI